MHEEEASKLKMETKNTENSKSLAMEEEATPTAAQKRFDGLVTVRNKAIKGKGAWYWTYLEPFIVQNAVKLKCLLCSSIFSASNPSRTASEHIKRATCPNFSIPKRPAEPSSLALIEVPPLVSVEKSVKRLKSPKNSLTPTTLTKPQADFALDCLADWVYESGSYVPLSSLEHPKFKEFLTQVGLPSVLTKLFTGSRLDARYEQARQEADARIKESLFFQVSSDGWKKESDGGLVSLTVNLPNGTTVFHKVLFLSSSQILPSKYVEEVLTDAVGEICVGSFVQKCVGIVSDRFKNKALRKLEIQHPWMVNLSCQYHGFLGLIKDFYKEFPLFMNVADSCLKLAEFVNNKTQVRSCFRKYQLQEYGCSFLLRVAENEGVDFEPVFSVIEDVMSSSRALQCLALDEAYKMVAMEEPLAQEIGEMIRDAGFWNNLEAVRCIVRLIKEMANEIETERPVIGQCLPLWEELRAKLKSLCVKFRVSDSVLEKIFERRYKKNYHPAWAAAYVLDPLYLLRDASGNYLPPFRHLTQQQEKDVDKLITRLVPKEEAHIALMELMKWRTQGLDPVYAQAVQLKQQDPITGKLKSANPHSSRLVWEMYLTEYRSLRKIAARLIFLNATTRGFKCNSSFLRRVNALGRNKAAIDKAQKMIFIAAHSKLKKRDLSGEDDKDGELFANGDEDVFNEAFVDQSSNNFP